jgi:nucleoid-associated protein YgaU
VQSSESLEKLQKEIDVKRGKGVSFMTSEAKIGLLLGLVVIVIIALVVNGLPSFHKEHSTNDLTRDMVRLDNSPPVLAEKERQVSRDVLTPNINLQPASQQGGLQPPNQQNIGTDVRSVIPVPGQTATGNQSAEGGSNLISQPAGGNLVATGQQTTAVSTAVPNQTTAGSGNVLIGNQQPALSQNQAVRNEQTTRPAAAQSKTYVVKSGDSLASIAVKCYGAKEGNRKVNIDRIFNANKNVLKSSDEIYEGQKLVIPSLPASTTEIASSTSTAGRITAGGSNAAVRSGADKEYVVSEGDSLWKIADVKLGNGTRYTEILKLNSDVLKNEDSLSVGMKLKLPAK